MNGKLRIISAFCLSILILASVGFYTYRTTNEYGNASEWVSHTQRVISITQNILLDIQAIESSQRGYVITGNEKYLEPYEEGKQDIRGSFDEVKNLIQYNPSQKSLLDSIRLVLELKMKFAEEVIVDRKNNGHESAQKLVMTNEGENLMTRIRASVNLFIVNEGYVLSERLDTTKKNYSRALNTIVISIFLAISIVIITLYFFIIDYNRRIRSEKMVLENETRIKKFLESLPVGVYVLDSKGKPYYANSKSTEILGKGILPGSSIANLPEIYGSYIAGTNNLYPAERQPIVRALNGETDLSIEDMEIHRGDGRIPLRINATNIRDSEKKIEYAIAVFEDITTVKEAEKKLIEARKLAEESAILKEAFLANMSHEIRTPMNAILGFTDLLLKRSLKEEEKDFVKTIKTSGENLLRIINDVLDVSKMESGMMSFEKQPIDIRDTFNSLGSMFSQKAKEKKLYLSFSFDSNLPEIVTGDPLRLSQILINLVGNAIKFTSKGGIDVFVKLLKKGSGIDYVQFSVKDTGIGISSDKLPYIFERFRQAESHTSRNYGGTGLGLSIAKQLIELQGGEIEVKSAEGIGTQFLFTLPFGKADSTYVANLNKNKGYDATVIAKKKLLVVEDNPINVKFILSLFKQYDIKTDIAENGKIAIDKFKNSNYDLILMDIEMPEMNGYETVDMIRNTLGSNVPIIAMTAHAMAGEKEKCLRLGMNAYVSKPISEELLFENMFNLLTIESHENTAINQTVSGNVINLDFLIKSVKNNKEIIVELIDAFLQQIKEDIAELNNAIVGDDYDAIKKIAHRTKSTVSLVGGAGMLKILEEIESETVSAGDIEKIKTLYASLKYLEKQSLIEIQIERSKYS